MFFAKIPRHTRQNAITEGDLECILTRNCEGTEQLQNEKIFEGEQTLKTIYTGVLTPNMSGSIMAEMKKRKSGVNR